MTWDDHEFANNYADLDLDPNQPLETVAQRRAAAYLAYWEHSPLPRSRKPVDQDMPMYRRSSWGDLVAVPRARHAPAPRRPGRLHRRPATQPSRLLPRGRSTRRARSSARSSGVAARRARPARPHAGTCSPTRSDSRRSTRTRTRPSRLRRRQLGRLRRRSPARARLDAEQQPTNPIVITGDAHVHSVRNVPPDFENFDAAPVATEFMGTSISSTDSEWPQVTTTFGGDAAEPAPPVPDQPARLRARRGDTGEWRASYLIVDAMQRARAARRSRSSSSRTARRARSGGRRMT